MSTTPQAGITSLADALAPASPLAPVEGVDVAGPARRIGLSVMQGTLDSELARLRSRRSAHGLLVQARQDNGATPEGLLSQVAEVLTQAAEELPTAPVVAPAPRQPIA